MQHNKYYLKAFLMLISISMIALIATSCKKDDDSGPSNAAEGTIVAKVDGNSVTTMAMTTMATRAAGSLVIQGNTAGTSSEAFTLTLIGYDGVGTYPLNGSLSIGNVATYIKTIVDTSNPTNPDAQTWMAPYDTTEVGEIKVTEETATHVKGTFHFKGFNSVSNSYVEVKDGSFNVKFNL